MKSVKYKEFDRIIVPPEYGNLFVREVPSFAHRMNLLNLEVGNVWFLTDQIQMAYASRDSFRNVVHTEIRKALGKDAVVAISSEYVGGYDCFKVARIK